MSICSFLKQQTSTFWCTYFFLNPLRLLWINPTLFFTWTCNFCVCGIQEDVFNKTPEKEAFFFCKSKIIPFILDNKYSFFFSHSWCQFVFKTNNFVWTHAHITVQCVWICKTDFWIIKFEFFLLLFFLLLFYYHRGFQKSKAVATFLYIYNLIYFV